MHRYCSGIPEPTLLGRYWLDRLRLGCCVLVFLGVGGVGVLPAHAVTSPEATECANRPGQAIRILPLGDSITEGGRRDRPEYTYRYPLFYQLRKAGYAIDFIGSKRTGLHDDATWPARGGVAFDPDHEGRYGWTTAQVRDGLVKWIVRYSAPPDVALIHLGSNDYGAWNYYAAIIRPLRDIVAMLRTSNPCVVILLGHLNERGWRPWIIRSMVALMAFALKTERSPVVTVPHHVGWTEDPAHPQTDTFDGAHPNLRGQKKMSEKWFAALVPLLERMKNIGEAKP